MIIYICLPDHIKLFIQVEIGILKPPRTAGYLFKRKSDYAFMGYSTGTHSTGVSCVQLYE
eukprot:SAG31_NODE_2399_length_5776_cov_8.236216_6_plen_60_part_00